MAKASHSIPEEKIALYDKLIAAHPLIERKGKAMPYTSLNGHMFSFLDATGTMGLRLSKEDAEAFVKKYKTPPMEQHGHIMKEYVVVPNKLLADTESLSAWLQKSYDYIASLKPKTTKK